jgi:hypothetical protein
VRPQETGGQAAGALLNLDTGLTGSNGDREPIGNDQDARHCLRYIW